MKKKLSFLLALVFILTLAFGMLPTAGATVDECPPIPQVGKLTVEKKLVNPNGIHDPLQTFTVNIQFAKEGFHFSTLNTDDKDVIDLDYLGNGKYQAVMNKNDYVTFSGVPVGATYVITEEPLPVGWDAPIFENEHGYNCDGTGVIKDANDNDTITVWNNYTCPLGTGTLEIRKVVEPNSLDSYDGAQFTVNVQLTLADFHFSYLLPTITKSEHAAVSYKGSGLYELKLGNGEWVLFNAVPVGTTYAVTETAVENWSGAVEDDDKWGDPDIIDSCGDPDVVTVTNTYTDPEPDTGTLTVKKTVDVDGAPDREFKIVVEFYGLEGTGGIDAPVQSDENTTNTYTLYLHDGDTAEFLNIPLGTYYSVVEEELADPWSHVSGGVDPQSETAFVGDTVIEIVNHYKTPTPPPQPVPPPPVVIETGSLTVAKTVSGTNASAAEKFAITVTFTPGGPDNWNVFGVLAPAGATGGNGVFTLSLSANDGPVTFTNIPIGATYTVSETLTAAQENNGWVQGNSTGLTGPITAAGASAVVANVNDAQVQGTADVEEDQGTDEETGQQVAGDVEILPQTGGIASSTLLGIFGLALIAVGGTAFTILRKKSDGKSKSK
jgi:LPXTG-motif cell wall-anchored protein